MEQTDIIADLQDILRTDIASTQEAICQALENKGHPINQSKISRLLRKIGAVKTKNASGRIVYRLPKEPAPPTSNSQLTTLVIDITYNETCLIVHAAPGSASLIARLIDHHRETLDILGTIAGDDTILVIPQFCKKIAKVHQNLIALVWH